MKLDYLIVGQRIRAIRKKQKLSQAVLSGFKRVVYEMFGS